MIVPNPPGPGMPCTMLAGGEVAQDQLLNGAKLSPHCSFPAILAALSPSFGRAAACDNAREPALMELVGKVLLVWIGPICRASHDGGITDGSLDNCGQKLDGRGLIRYPLRLDPTPAWGVRPSRGPRTRTFHL
jgi:hypothetical protein